MRLALNILEGQNFAMKNHHRIRPRRAGASELGSSRRSTVTVVCTHTARSRRPESMRLALDILEGQNFARKNHHRIGPRRAGASELAIVEALDRHKSARRPNTRKHSWTCSPSFALLCSAVVKRSGR
jgi:hypothetical protein